MPYEIGDPNHIHVHNQLITDIQEQADRMAVTVVLPPPRALGDLEHTDDHNLIVAALQAIADAPAGGIPWAVVSGGTVTEYTHPEHGVMEVHTFTANGSLAVVQQGYADVLVVSGGSGNSGASGNAGDVVRGLHFLPAGAQTVVVGPGADGANGTGRQSRIGTAVVSSVARPALTTDGTVGAGGDDTTYQTGLTSSITGTPTVYAAANAADIPNSGNGRAGANGSSGVVIVAVKKPGA